MNERYSLTFRGEIAPGQDPDKVRHKVQVLLNIDPLRLERLFSGQKVFIKKGLDRAMAGRCKKAFEATGAICAIEQDSLVKPLQQQASPARMIRCPKCDMEQQEALTCIYCGIAIAKYQRLQSAQLHGMPEVGQVFPDAASHKPNQKELSAARSKGLAAFIRTLMIIALIAGSGFAAYRHFARSPEVNMVFTSNDCGDPCQSALVHLQQAGVDFTECNVDDSPENLEMFMKYRSNSLPLGIINSKILIGYNQATYQDVINELQGIYLQESSDAVVMYSTQGCGYCRRAREFFAEHNIEYIENDIANPSNRRRYEELGGRGVPLILIRGTRIDGFQQKAIAKALRDAGLL